MMPARNARNDASQSQRFPCNKMECGCVRHIHLPTQTSKGFSSSQRHANKLEAAFKPSIRQLVISSPQLCLRLHITKYTSNASYATSFFFSSFCFALFDTISSFCLPFPFLYICLSVFVVSRSSVHYSPKPLKLSDTEPNWHVIGIFFHTLYPQKSRGSIEEV